MVRMIASIFSFAVTGLAFSYIPVPTPSFLFVMISVLRSKWVSMQAMVLAEIDSGGAFTTKDVDPVGDGL